MIRKLVIAVIFASLPFLQGCESVSRFGDSLDPRTSPPQRVASNAPFAISATPTPPVTSQPLPPPPPRFSPSAPIAVSNAGSGSAGASDLSSSGGLSAPLTGGVSAPAAGGLTPNTDFKGASDVKSAAITPSAPVKVRPQAPTANDTAPEKPSQSRLTGGWSVAQGSGSKCRLTLSNSPALDLYKAQTTGCSTGLTKVNAWELRGDEIYLYEQGGAVAARLKQSGNSSFNGSTAKSGAPVSISK